jgi:predicted hotdog family 3-hydroxylacyl-ACP dehydratase
MSSIDWGDIESLIPHRGESVLVDRVVDHDGDTTTTGIVVGRQPWLVREDGGVAPWLVIEYMAQSIATHEGILARVSGYTLPLGFLVAVVGLEFVGPPLRAGERVEVQTRRVRGRPGLGVLSHQCSLYRRDGEETEVRVAEGRLSISIPKQ